MTNKASKLFITSVITLRRNFADIPFDTNRNQENSKICLDRIETKIDNSFKGLKKIPLSKVTIEERKFLAEEALIPAEYVQVPGYSVLYKNYTNDISILLCAYEHISISVKKHGINLEKALKTAKFFEHIISGGYDFAKKEGIGFLTSNPMFCGTGISSILLMHLPMLTMSGKFNSFLKQPENSHFSIMPMFGSDDIIPSIVLISNKSSIAKNEEDLIKKTTSLGFRAAVYEYVLRKEILKDNMLILRDKYKKACGVIQNANMLEYSEFLSLWSILRLSAESKIIKIPFSYFDKLISGFSDYHISQSKDISTGKRAVLFRFIMSHYSPDIK